MPPEAWSTSAAYLFSLTPASFHLPSSPTPPHKFQHCTTTPSCRSFNFTRRTAPSVIRRYAINERRTTSGMFSPSPSPSPRPRRRRHQLFPPLLSLPHRPLTVTDATATAAPTSTTIFSFPSALNEHHPPHQRRCLVATATRTRTPTSSLPPIPLTGFIAAGTGAVAASAASASTLPSFEPLQLQSLTCTYARPLSRSPSTDTIQNNIRRQLDACSTSSLQSSRD